LAPKKSTAIEAKGLRDFPEELISWSFPSNDIGVQDGKHTGTLADELFIVDRFRMRLL